MIDKILDIIYPPRCPFCQEILTERKPVCNSCMNILPFVPENSCRVCQRPLDEFSHPVCHSCRLQKIYFEHSFVPLVYKDEARDAAIALKTEHPYFKKGFAYLMADRILSSPYYTDFDCVTFVPQSPKGNFQRGYNQAQLIAKELSKLLKVPCRSFLKRTNAGADQHTLSAVERKQNVRKCYFPKKKKGLGTVLLVDDIYTTGATTNYCSYLLRKMGFDKVYIVVSMIRADD